MASAIPGTLSSTLRRPRRLSLSRHLRRPSQQAPRPRVWFMPENSGKIERSARGGRIAQVDDLDSRAPGGSRSTGGVALNAGALADIIFPIERLKDLCRTSG
jgi:hypothetical protein